MNMKHVILVCSALAVSSTLTMHAQQTTPKPSPDAGVLFAPIKQRTPLETKVVKGMPYSADIVSESIQTLADGNRIVQRSTGRVYRDVDGRMRREDDRPSGSPSITITDPVANTSFTLDADHHTARETFGLRLVEIQYALSDLDAYRLAMPTLTLHTDPAGAVGARSGGAGGRGTGGAVGGGRGGGGVARSEPVEEKLPNRWIEGVLCTGVRRTTTIAQGAIGNDLPIKIVSEEWTSVDLQVLVMTDFNDPRTGRSTYQLQGINRSNPASDLFKVPADYTVQRMGGRGRGGNQ